MSMNTYVTGHIDVQYNLSHFMVVVSMLFPVGCWLANHARRNATFSIRTVMHCVARWLKSSSKVSLRRIRELLGLLERFRILVYYSDDLCLRTEGRAGQSRIWVSVYLLSQHITNSSSAKGHFHIYPRNTR